MQSCGSFITLSVTKLCFQGYFIYFDVTLQSMMLIYKVLAQAVLWGFSTNKWAVLLLDCGCSDIGLIISNVGVQMLGILFLAKGVFE